MWPVVASSVLCFLLAGSSELFTCWWKLNLVRGLSSCISWTALHTGSLSASWMTFELMMPACEKKIRGIGKCKQLWPEVRNICCNLSIYYSIKYILWRKTNKKNLQGNRLTARYQALWRLILQQRKISSTVLTHVWTEEEFLCFKILDILLYVSAGKCILGSVK